MPTDKRTVEAYNKNAKKWLERKGFGHSHLEKPAMYAALGDVKGKRILCLGCGAGEECAYFVARGATVVGVDISKSLIEKARHDVPEAVFHVMDIEKIPFPQSSFDIVYSSLVLHYLKDWTLVLEKVRSVLRPKGIFLFSTHHPAYWGAEKIETKDTVSIFLGFSRNRRTKRIVVSGDYIHARKIHDVWNGDFHVTYYHRPLSHLLRDIINSGLKLVDCIEPRPLLSAKKLNPSFFEQTDKLPLFIIFKLVK